MANGAAKVVLPPNTYHRKAKRTVQEKKAVRKVFWSVNINGIEHRVSEVWGKKKRRGICQPAMI